MVTAAKEAKPQLDATIKVLIVDDHPVVREGLRAMLRSPGINVVGDASSGREAIERARELRPDVVLMDVKMPEMDGLAATRELKAQFPTTTVVVVTSYDTRDYLRKALEAGASGYLIKGASREKLIQAVKMARTGESLVDAELLTGLFAEPDTIPASGATTSGPTLSMLSPREMEALEHLTRGLTNKEIAREMHYSVGTVKNVVQSIIVKLGVSDRTQAAVFAVRAGLEAK